MSDYEQSAVGKWIDEHSKHGGLSKYRHPFELRVYQLACSCGAIYNTDEIPVAEWAGAMGRQAARKVQP